MNLLERPNLLSIIILSFVVLVAGTYGYLTYTQSPDLEHYNVDPDYQFMFNFDSADEVLALPDDLKEISGLCPWFDDDHILAVQDEQGTLFVLSTTTGQVEQTFSFNKDKDYEGLARVDSTIYVLEQDGDLHHFKYDGRRGDYDAEKIETDFSYRNDTEGITYDKRTNSLLIVPKEQELNPADQDDYRHGIYAYSLEDSAMVTQPVFYIDEFEVGKAVYDKRARYKFKPSGISIDPITGDIYVIASVGKIMIVIDRESDIKHIELLKEKVFRQPEGVEFNSQGDLYISSEGKGKKAILARYNRGAVVEDTKDQQDE